jgi:ADP-dependent NAD(P)H-hydrate dehydratase / NAD(P)H-hydrate epimerase
VLWGATAAVTVVLLDALEPGWRGGSEPADLADDTEIAPWLDPGLQGRVQAPRLEDVDARERGGIGAPSGPPDAAAVAGAGAAIVTAVERLRDRPDQIVVLAGSGHNGAAGAAAATLLRRRGARVAVVAADAERLPHDGRRAQAFDGTLPPADLYVDALVGGGLRGRLRGSQLAMLLALRVHDAPIMAVDLPTGLHPTAGLIGDTLSATVTVALGGVWPVLRHAGLAPFVGDLYLWEGPGPDIVRLVAGPERAALHGGWRE